MSHCNYSKEKPTLPLKIAFVAKAHFDVSIALLNELSEFVEIDFVMLVGGKRHTESIFDFDLENVPYGLINNDRYIKGLMGKMGCGVLSDKVKIKMFHLPSWKIRSFSNLLFVFSFLQYLATSNYDLIHINGTFGIYHILFYLRLLGRCKIQSIHDSTSHTGEKNIQHTIVRNLFRFTRNRFIFHSKYSACEFIAKYKVKLKKIHVIPFGPLSLYRNELDIKSKKNEILFFGRISPYKGIEYLIGAFRIVKREVPDSSLVIAGGGGIYFPIHNIKDDSSILIDNRYISNEVLSGYIRRCGVVALPYTDATQSAVVLTAFAYEKPLVATAVGGISEVIINNETGLLVPPRDSRALALALIRILSDEKLRKRIIKNIRYLCSSTLSWKNIALQTYKVYKKALSEKSMHRYNRSEHEK